MVSQNHSTTTARFLDPWPWLALAATGGIFLSLLAAAAPARTLLSTQVTVQPDGQKPATSPFTFQPSTIGALRTDVRAQIPAGRWLTYEVQLRDAQGKVLAAALKEAWRESGTWYEDGQSGTWDESDVRGGLDVRTRQSETVTLSIAVLDYTNTAGQAINESVNFSVTVKNGVVDVGYLWPGFIGATLFSLLGFWATAVSGQRAIATVVQDSDPSDRAILGGADSLIRTEIEILGDETSPRQFQVQLKIHDGNGVLIYGEKHPLGPTLHKDDGGKLDHTTGSLKLFFILEPQSSYRFSVEVFPDGPIDRTTLNVFRDACTRVPVEVTQLKAV